MTGAAGLLIAARDGDVDAAVFGNIAGNLKTAVAARQIPLDEMRGATITLSNFGVSGAGRFANLVVVPPQVAIVGAGTIRPQVVARNGQPAVRRTLPVSLTFDHRCITGGEAARFLAALIRDLERGS